MGLKPWTLLRLYPAAWRERYGDEFIALLEREGTGTRVVLNVLAGAFDAWVSPKVTGAYAPADADTFRFWRVQPPPDTRTYRERLPQIVLALALFAGFKAVAALLDAVTLDLAALPMAGGVASIPFWYEGFGPRTKVAAAAAMAAFMYCLSCAVILIWP